MFQAEQQNDKTPGALLFFAALYDPAAITSMHNLLSELKHMRGVAECKEHVDFSVLRSRILVCLANTPSLERLLNKFTKMHSSWTQNRAKVFSIRNQAGGDADASYACPLCNHDSRMMSVYQDKLTGKAKLHQKKSITHRFENQQGGHNSSGIPIKAKQNRYEEIKSMNDSQMSVSLQSSASLGSMERQKKTVMNKIKNKNW